MGFKSMEDVQAFLDSMKNFATPEQYKALEKLLGAAPQEGITEDIQGIGPIDVSIVKYIEGFNKIGFKTLACCSG